ncbi:MAG: cell division protein SepF [Limnochordia bacterium]|jgi:cell division inhibitor SepF|nr:cell division protein SepF [Bacillota bacterium]
MGFLDRVLGLMGVQVEHEEESEAAPTVPEEKPSRWQRKRTPAPVVNLPSQRQPIRVVVLEPLSYDEVQQIADHLKGRRPVILRVTDLDRDLAKRIVDFASGTIYALDGSVQQLGDGIYLFAPNNVVIDADETSLSRGFLDRF